MNAPLQAIRIGPIAAEVLAVDGDVEVAAVFERCFYVAAPRGFVCIGVEALGDGPLNVLLDLAAGAPDWAAFGITREAKGAVTSGRLHIGDRFALSVGAVPQWRPPPWPPVSEVDIARGVVAVRRLAPPLCPAEGLSRLVIGDARRADRTARAAAVLVRDLQTALVASLPTGAASADLVRSATLLIGLGPGLTPSGDDLLGGILLALSALGQAALRDDLWRALEDELEHLTVGISAAHLAASADGLASAAVHDALIAILRGDAAALPHNLSALAAIGHSSGFDTLAGLVLACEAALAVGAAHRR